MPNGKFRYREKYLDEYDIWRKVSVTMNSKTSETQREAVKALERKIQKKLENAEETVEKVKLMTVKEVYKDSSKKRKMELAPSSYYQETCFIKVFLKKFGKYKIRDVKARDLQDYIVNNAKSVKTIHAHRKVS